MRRVWQMPGLMPAALALALGGAGWVAGAADVGAFIAQFLVVWLACRSWQMLAAQCGLYSFGHALLTGFGAYAAVWTLRWLGGTVPGLCLIAVPIAGAIAGALAGALMAQLASRTRATAFAMLTFGLGELVHLLAQAAPAWFGGESGLSADRALGQFALGGFGFAAPAVLNLLLGLWVALGLVWCAWVEAGALGTAMRLVRDNPLRAQSLGLTPRRVRARAMFCAGLAAGVAGALFALVFEVATPEAFATQRSLGWMMAVLIGGVGASWGAAWGAGVHVLFAVALSLQWPAWQLGYGLLFVVVMLARPDGLASRRGSAA